MPAISGRIFAALARLDVKVVRLRAALVDEVLGQPPVALFPRNAIQPHQGEFDLFVARIAVALALARAEGAIDEIRVAAHHLQELALAGGLEVGHGRLDKVPGTVEFVLVPQVGPASTRLDDGVVHVQVAVGPLGGGEAVHHAVNALLQRRIGVCRQGVGRGLDPFGHVGLPEEVRRVRLPLPPLHAQGVQGAAVLQYPVLQGDGHLAVRDLAGCPERVVDRDPGERNGMSDLHRAQLLLIPTRLRQARGAPPRAQGAGEPAESRPAHDPNRQPGVPAPRPLSVPVTGKDTSGHRRTQPDRANGHFTRRARFRTMLTVGEPSGICVAAAHAAGRHPRMRYVP